MTARATSSPSTRVSPAVRAVLVAPALLALIYGMASGLARLGLAMPGGAASLAGVHGALMIGGFFGTLIGLERAVALGARWTYLGPLLSGCAALALCSGASATLAALLMSGAAAIMTAACVVVWLRERVPHHATLATAALAWLLGNGVWLGQGSVLPAVPLWSVFLILTIAGERLEMSRLVRTPAHARQLFALIVVGVMAGALAAAWPDYAVAGIALRGLALALLALAAWLLRYDIARRTVRTQGLTRYMAVCLLSGYVWLGVAGVFGTLGAFAPGQVLRDAALHALLLGFVLAMVFGHAPVIVPALTRLRMRWHAGFYLPLALLHVGIAVRVWAGVAGDFGLRQWAGMLNAATVVLFLLVVVESLLRGRTMQRQPVRN